MQPEPRQDLWKSREDAHTPEPLSPQTGSDHGITQVGGDLGKFLFPPCAQSRVSYESDWVAWAYLAQS